MALALLSALLMFAASPPYDLWAFEWVALVPLLLAMRGTSPRQAALLGAITGTAINFAGFRWCVELMLRFSKLGPAAYLVMLLMALYQCLPWALWGYFLRAPGPARSGPSRSIGAMLLAAASFVALEYFFPVIFPWYLANTQHSRPELTSIVELGGVSLLSLAIVGFNLCLARLFVDSPAEPATTLWPAPLPTASRRILLLPLLAIPFLLLGWHALARRRVEAAMATAPKLGIGLVQTNEWIGQGHPIQGLHDYQKMSQELVDKCRQAGQKLDLIVWPESAVRTPPPMIERLPEGSDRPITEPANSRRRFPLDTSFISPSSTRVADTLPEEGDFATTEDLLAVQRGHATPILFGTTLEDVGPQARAPIPGRAPLYNCGVLVDATGKVLGAVKKVKLLMFGETIPGASSFPQIYRLLPSASALLPGKEPGVISMGSARLGIMICYEDLLPWFHYLLAQKRPQILMNMTNDAWFGKTAEPICHLDLAALRAVEGRTYLIRSTPTGISAVIDPFGRVVASIPSDSAGTLREEVALLDVDTGFERWGNWVAWLCLGYLLLFGGAWWAAGRRQSAP
jgi:apolipoprotein N-acyltransferase